MARPAATATIVSTHGQGKPISIDNPNGPYGNYPSTGQTTVPYAFGAGPDTGIILAQGVKHHQHIQNRP